MEKLPFICKRSQLKTVKYLVENGADVNASDDDSWTPLHVASANGYFEITKYFVENGADVNALNNDRQTPLHVLITWQL